MAKVWKGLNSHKINGDIDALSTKEIGDVKILLLLRMSLKSSQESCRDQENPAAISLSFGM